ncbi:MAG: hypothetical protein JW881_09040 [Spirochaetales bacterium]|nr:hypothetical protein [Spirochaetales bacterium]
MGNRRNTRWLYIPVIFIALMLMPACVSQPPEETTNETAVSDSGTDETHIVAPEPTETPLPTPSPKPEPTPVPTQPPEPQETPGPQKGECWLVTENTAVGLNTNFTTKLFTNTGDQGLAAYGIKIKFDPEIIDVDKAVGINGAEAGPKSFLAAANVTKPGEIMIAGFDTSGKKGGEVFHIATIHWKAKRKGTTKLEIIIDNLIDSSTTPIGTMKGHNSEIEVR